MTTATQAAFNWSQQEIPREHAGMADETSDTVPAHAASPQWLALQQEVNGDKWVRWGPAESKATHYLWVCFDDYLQDDAGKNTPLVFLCKHRVLLALVTRDEGAGEKFIGGKRHGTAEKTGVGYCYEPRRDLEAEHLYGITPLRHWERLSGDKLWKRGENEAYRWLDTRGNVQLAKKPDQLHGFDFFFRPHGYEPSRESLRIEVKCRGVHQRHAAVYAQVGEWWLERKD